MLKARTWKSLDRGEIRKILLASSVSRLIFVMGFRPACLYWALLP